MTHPYDNLPPVQIECFADEAFSGWVAQIEGSLIVSTYQSGKVAAIGWDGRRVSLLMREFEKPMGLAVQGTRMALATRREVTFFANDPLLAPAYDERRPGRYDALFLPRATYHTGDIHTHDIAFENDHLVVVNTRFSCLARLSRAFCFEPFWRPKFISELAPEDRCHLNGLCYRDGAPRYVTALGTTDAPGGWRQRKATGGVLIDIASDETVLSGLSMPHSPRWHDGRLWVLNSGAGELLAVDHRSGKADVVCRLPGYLRGLCFAHGYALVGLSKIRERHIFGGLPLQENGTPLRCGVAVVDLRSGSPAGFFEFTAGCEELFEVQFLPRARRPMILNLLKPAVHEAMNLPERSYWLRPGRELPDPDPPYGAGAEPVSVMEPR